MSVGQFILLFLCAGAWTAIVATCAGLFVLHAAHVGRTGAPPFRTPSISFFRRKPADDDDDEPKPGNGRGRSVNIGP